MESVNLFTLKVVLLLANFNSVPSVTLSRSKFQMPYTRKQSMNVGTLYPFMVQEVYPGDTFKDKCNYVARISSNFIKPPMDNLFMDTYFFFVPARLTFDQWQEIFGENKNSAWAQSAPVSGPTLYNGDTQYKGVVGSRSVGNYLGLPLGEIPAGISMVPFRAFALIYDEWFRDENVSNPMQVYKGSWIATEILNGQAWSAGNYTGMCPKVSKFHDYFTSALPGTQKGSEIAVPLGNLAPVVPVGGSGTSPRLHNFTSGNYPQISSSDNGNYALNFIGRLVSGGSGVRDLGFGNNGGESPSDYGPIYGWNLYSDLSGVGPSVNDLRYSFAMQRILERAARSGTRYTEYLLSTFGVQSSDARLQRPEYLGGNRQPLSIQQVAQTVPTAGNEDVGTLGAFSLSNGHCGFEKGFTEHGFVIGVCCIRQHHTYQQGIEKFWHRHNRFDYYDPSFANIGEQPIYRSEIYASSEANLKEHIFGYQEAWADLRYRQASVAGDMASDSTRTIGGQEVSTSLDIWHFADDFSGVPTLNQSFIEETDVNVNRTIAVNSSALDQFIVDFYVDQEVIRCLPAYSVPGLIDHH